MTERDDEREKRHRDEREEEDRRFDEDERRLRQLRESWRERHPERVEEEKP
jgi:hypothetical protein